MDSTTERTAATPPSQQAGRPPDDRGEPAIGAVGDADLVRLAVEAQVCLNAAHARRLGATFELHRRCERDQQARRAAARQPRFVLTPGQETAVEMGPALGVSETSVLVDVHLVEQLTRHFPRFWSECLSGRLDVAKAAVLIDAASTIADADDVDRFAELMDRYLDREDDPDAPLVPLTRTQVQNAARYRKLKFRQKSPEDTFAEAFQKRRVRLDLETTGTGSLVCKGASTDLMLADHRLTLIARKRCENDPEGRTLEQMRADTAIDLLLGRLRVGALSSELEEDVTVDGQDPAVTFEDLPLVGAWARPVINVTVPISCLLGLSDDPGLLSGDIAIPPEAVRRIAEDPGSTWYRLLTDHVGTMLDLSTTGYEPTPAIWRAVVARDRTCLWPGCSRPSTQSETDHRTEHPEGETSVHNLGPLCKRHHKAKHADGFRLELLDDGRFRITTRRGMVHHVRAAEQPLATWPSSRQLSDRELVPSGA